MSSDVRPAGECAAFLAAPLGPAALSVLIAGSFESAAITYVIALGHVLIAAPCYVASKRRLRPSLPVCAVAGLLVGAVPIGIVTLTTLGSTVAGASPVGGYVATVLMFAFCGMLGGTVFWLVLQVSREWSGNSARVDYLMGGGAIAAGIMIFVPGVDKREATCHDIRGGEVVLGIDATIPSEDWGRLVALTRDFAADERLKFRNDSDLGVAWPRFLAISMCADDGFRIRVDKQKLTKEDAGPVGRGVSISFHLANARYEWRKSAHALISRLENEWPDSVRFTDSGGHC